MILELLEQTHFQNNIPQGIFLYGKIPISELKYRNIVIWGTGEMANSLTLYLKRCGISPQAYCDNNPAVVGMTLHGVACIKPEDAYVMDEAYFILTMSYKNLDIVMRQVLTRFNDDFSVVFRIQFGNYFDDPTLTETIVDAINITLVNNIKKKGIEWFKPLFSIMFGENLDYLIRSVKFWDNFVKYVQLSTGGYNMLEIGPGHGTFSLIVSMLQDKIKSLSWLSYSHTLIAPETYYIDQTNQTYPVMRYYGEIENPDFSIDRKFNIICMFEVMEHFRFYPIPTLRKISDMLTEDGILCISTPTLSGDPCRNYESYKQLPVYKTSSTIYERKNETVYLDISEAHQHIYTTSELREVFDEVGLRIKEHCEIYGHHRIILEKMK